MYMITFQTSNDSERMFLMITTLLFINLLLPSGIFSKFFEDNDYDLTNSVFLTPET